MNTKFYKFIIVVILFSSQLIISGCQNGCPFIKRDTPIAPSASTEIKFKEISKWIPEKSNIVAYVDIYKVKESPLWSNLLLKFSGKISGFLGSQNLNLDSDLGMFAVFMALETPVSGHGPIFILQGGFNQDLLVSKVKLNAAKSNVEIKSEDYKGKTIYYEFAEEEGVARKYGFVALGKGMFAIADKENLKWMLDSKEKSFDVSKVSPDFDWNIPIWGMADLSKDITAQVPPPWNAIKNIFLSASLGEDISAKFKVEVSDPKETNNIKVSLEGFKALEALQALENPETLAMVEKISITSNENSITVDVPEDLKLMTLLFAKEKKVEMVTQEEKDELESKEPPIEGEEVVVEEKVETSSKEETLKETTPTEEVKDE